MRIIRDTQLIEHVFEYDVVLFGMGINNSMNNGFSYEIALNFPCVKENENLSKYGDKNKYGTISETTSNGIVFCACYVYNIGMKRRKDSVFIDYDSLKKSLELCKNRYNGKKIAAPIIGQDNFDGNGDKDRIIGIFNKVFGDECDITLYDFVQDNFNTRLYRKAVDARYRLGRGEITKDEFNNIMRNIEWKRLNGIYKPIDNEFKYKKKLKNLKKFG